MPAHIRKNQPLGTPLEMSLTAHNKPGMPAGIHKHQPLGRLGMRLQEIA